MGARGHTQSDPAVRVKRQPAATFLHILASQSPRSAMDQTARPSSRDDFTIAIICALTIEADAVVALFDRYWDDDEEKGNASPYDKAPGDAASYSAGRIGRHNVVVVHMPRDGKARAASVATYCRMSWPGVKLALVVGICGAVPFTASDDEIILGDVVISEAVIQFDLGRRLPGQQFIRKDTLLDSPGRPSEEILGLLAKLKGVRDKKKPQTKMESYLAKLREDPDLKAAYPGVEHDALFAADYDHLKDGEACFAAGCSGDLIKRDRLAIDKPGPSIHFGLIASGDTVMKSAGDRDSIAKKEGVIAFEMESAGLWGVFPCIVVKGVCDYADSHKAKGWQRYAAATAAACSKAFLEHWAPSLQAEKKRPAETPRSTPSQWHRPYQYLPLQKNRRFVGRTSILNTLHQKLFSDDDDEASRRVAIVGLGGVGKTQVALQTAYWVRENKPEWHVFWVPALSIASFDQACRAIARMIWPDGSDKGDAKELLRRYLESDDSGRWILIVDNADDEDLVEGQEQGICDFLPESDRGRILFTTRAQEIAFRLAENEIVNLSQMEDDDAFELLGKSLGDQSLLEDRKTVAELLSVLTRLPLAITQAAAYLTVTKITVNEYLRLLQNTEHDMVEVLETEFADPTRYNTRHHGTSNAVARTWVVSFEQIRKNPDAARLLSFMAQVEYKAIPLSMLPPAETDQKMARAIGVLDGYSFLSMREDRKTCDMHRLVHLASQVWVKKQDPVGEQRRAALQHLETIFFTDEWEERETWRYLLAHVVKAIKVEAEDESWGKEECELGFWAGKCLRREGRGREAMQLLERVVAVRKTALIETHPDRLMSQHELARTYRKSGRVKEAITLLEQVVAAQEITLAETHSHRLSSQHELARAYHADDRVKEAITLLELVVAVQETTLDETHPDRLRSQRKLASVYLDDGRVKEAIALLEQAVAIHETTLTETHPERLRSQAYLASSYYKDGQTDRAVGLLRLVVAGYQKTSSVDHPNRLRAERWLNRYLREQGAS
ncbi:hypothetical protein F5X68DRAFT_170313 [Plectosphaerella plurivora]|uniref:Kinesin light chain n=1 Tax=Plectosphaerella plurivora TaxID=936078 RepID=A0A9P8VAW9_9PEZI|nr:hypothetical protein F5X68DRAFT_170313 [Plectosphaerella plurivora]